MQLQMAVGEGLWWIDTLADLQRVQAALGRQPMDASRKN